MSTPAFTRHGTWWVTTADGRSIQRTGRDTLTYQEGQRLYHIPVEIGEIGSIVVFNNAVRATDGWVLSVPEQQEVFARATELLRLSGDPFIVE